MARLYRIVIWNGYGVMFVRVMMIMPVGTGLPSVTNMAVLAFAPTGSNITSAN
jgi:hypothetical protein